MGRGRTNPRGDSGTPELADARVEAREPSPEPVSGDDRAASEPRAPEANTATSGAPPAPAAEEHALEEIETEHVASPEPEAAAREVLSAPECDVPSGILCRVGGPGAVAGFGRRVDGRPAYFWHPGECGYFSQASIDKLPHLLIPEST